VVLKIFYEIKLRKFYIRIYDNTARQNTGLWVRERREATQMSFLTVVEDVKGSDTAVI
jgi:hypothetical protein